MTEEPGAEQRSLDEANRRDYRRLLERAKLTDDELTRRRLIAALGATTAGGIAISATSPAAAGEPRRRASQVGTGPTGRSVAGFIGIVKQVGTDLTAFGYLTSIAGLSEGSLFTSPRATDWRDPNSTDEGKARFTVHSRTTITSVSATERTITALARGRLSIFFQVGGGADFDDPSSFGAGTEIASFSGRFQNNLALEPPDFMNNATFALGGDLKQTGARSFTLGGRRRELGETGELRSLVASGRGQLEDPGPPESTLFIAGSLAVVGED